jgi:hypothetical protein
MKRLVQGKVDFELMLRKEDWERGDWRSVERWFYSKANGI